MSDRSLRTLHPETNTRIRISEMAEELTSKDAAAAEYDCAFAARHGTGRCKAQRPCRRRQEDLISSPFSDCFSARRRPIFGLWLTWHHPAVRAMPRRAFRRLTHSAETQAAEMWPLFSLISVVSVFWLLDLTVVDLLPSSDPFTRYRFKPCRVPRKFHPAAHSSLVTLPRPAKV
jgi:hypothetical protein